MKLFLIGILIGIAKILPGVSGAVLALMFGVYEILIESIGSLKKTIKNIKKLIPLILGICLSIVLTSTLINHFTNRFYNRFLALIVGIMIYEVIDNLKCYRNKIINTKYLIASLFTILVLIVITNIKITTFIDCHNTINPFITLFFLGIIDAASTVIPGVSGTAILLLFGYYKKIIYGISTLNISIIFPFGIGFIIGLIIFSRMLTYLFKKYRLFVDYMVTSFSMFSTLSLIITLFKGIYTFEYFIVFLNIILGYCLISIINKKLV